MKRVSHVGVRRAVIIATVMLCLVFGQVTLSWAATTTVLGTKVAIAPLDNFAKTVQDQAVTNWAKILGVILVIGGALSMLRLPALGAIGVVAGLLVIFSNPIIEATFTGTSALPVAAAIPTTAPEIPLLLRPLVVLASVPYLVLRVVDCLGPSFWFLLALTIAFRRRLASAYCRVAG